MALREFDECFKLDVSEEVMPDNMNTYDNANMCACSIQDALDVLKKNINNNYYMILTNGFVFLVTVWRITCLIRLNITTFIVR